MAEIWDKDVSVGDDGEGEGGELSILNGVVFVSWRFLTGERDGDWLDGDVLEGVLHEAGIVLLIVFPTFDVFLIKTLKQASHIKDFVGETLNTFLIV